VGGGVHDGDLEACGLGWKVGGVTVRLAWRVFWLEEGSVALAEIILRKSMKK
jgi:hypothetical protein